MIFDKNLFEELLSKAAESNRLRFAYDLRNNNEDHSQRMLNALCLGTIIPIHRHKASNETIIVLKGALEQFIYNEHGEIIEKHFFVANSDKNGMLIPSNTWHKINVLEPTVIFEAKDGKYMPLNDDDLMKL